MQVTKRLIKDTFIIQRKAEELTAQIKANTEKIQVYFDNAKTKELVVESDTDNDVALIAKKSERVTIDYIADKLKEKLNPDIFNEIARKDYHVEDMQGFIAMLKNAGVSAKDFKKFIRVEQSIDKAEVRRLYATGDIKKSDIKGCYTAKVVKSVKISQRPQDG